MKWGTHDITTALRRRSKYTDIDAFLIILILVLLSIQEAVYKYNQFTTTSLVCGDRLIRYQFVEFFLFYIMAYIHHLDLFSNHILLWNWGLPIWVRVIRFNHIYLFDQLSCTTQYPTSNISSAKIFPITLEILLRCWRLNADSFWTSVLNGHVPGPYNRIALDIV